MAKEIDRIAGMLRAEESEKRIAAAIVLGELGARSPAVLEGLGTMLASGMAPLERAALGAAGQIGARKLLPGVLALLASGDPEVREAAARALVRFGDAVVEPLRQRYASAEAEERRALDAVLAELGGKDAFSALLEGLLGDDRDAARRAALQVRQQVREASAIERRGYRSQTERFCKRKDVQLCDHALAAAVKILGYLEDPKVVPTLIAHASNVEGVPLVRQEALIALRFALQQGTQVDAVIGTLIDVVNAEDRQLSRTALDTIGLLEIPTRLLAKFARLSRHPHPGYAKLVIDKLGTDARPAARKALLEVVEQGDPRTIGFALEALTGCEAVTPTLARMLMATDDEERARLLERALRPRVASLSPAQRIRLIDGAVARLAEGQGGSGPVLQVARAADAEGTARALRDLAARLRKGKKAERERLVLGVLCGGDGALPEDRYRLASLDLQRSHRDTSPASRLRDPALVTLAELAAGGFDVAAAMRKDRALGDAERYYAGFHFAEQGDPLGEDLLNDVVKRGGRTKLARMARNKLKLIDA